jgi:hypothetical protein
VNGKRLTQVVVTLLLLAAPRTALACPVCFGENDSPLTNAMRVGVIFMLVIVAGVLAAFASFFIYLMRRAKMVARQSEGIAET